MARRGIDYAWGRPSIEAIKGAGASFACRYLSWLPNNKCLSRAEADGLRAGGIDVVSNWEYYGDWLHDFSGGYDQGRTHATEAARQHVQCGGPPSRPIYFSTDWDVTDAQKPTIAAYYRGVASVIGLERTGAYGGYWVIKYLFDVGAIRWGWQTYAWSGGNWDGRAQLRQVKNNVQIGGVACDLDDAVTADFGQWGAEMLEEIVPQTGNRTVGTCLSDVWNGFVLGRSGFNGDVHHLNGELDGLGAMTADLKRQVTELKAAEEARGAAFLTAITSLTDLVKAGGGDVDSAAIITAINQAGTDAQSTVRDLVAELVELRQRLASAYGAEQQ